jgi:hypothetical protein
MFGYVAPLVVDVDKGAIDVGERLDALLQRLGDVVRVLQRHLATQHDVDLDQKTKRQVKSSHCIDCNNLRMNISHKSICSRKFKEVREASDSTSDM